MSRLSIPDLERDISVIISWERTAIHLPKVDFSAKICHVYKPLMPCTASIIDFSKIRDSPETTLFPSG
jgi:hypothetical protein